MLQERGTNLPRAKVQNRELIKTAVYREGPVSRQDIATALGLTLPTITTAVASYLQSGLFQEVKAPKETGGEKPMGRPTLYIDYQPQAYYAIGVEIWSRALAFCVTDIRGNIIRSREIPHPCDENYSYETLLDLICQQVTALWNDCQLPHEKLLGLGVGLPGPVYPSQGILYRAGSYAWGSQRPVAKDLSQRLQMPVWIENNARARAKGEQMRVDRQRPHTFAYLLSAQGVVCPVMFGGDIVVGDRTGAGEIGHIPVGTHEETCSYCQRTGCLQQAVSQGVLLEKAETLLTQGNTPKLAQQLEAQQAFDPDTGQTLRPLYLEDLMQGAKGGDQALRRLFSKASESLGVAASVVINLLSPQLLMVDCRWMRAPVLWDVFTDTIEKCTEIGHSTALEYLPYDCYQGAKGAAALVLQKGLLEQPEI